MPRSLGRYAARCFLTAPLPNDRGLTAGVLARCQFLLTEEAASRARRCGGRAKRAGDAEVEDARGPRRCGLPFSTSYCVIRPSCLRRGRLGGELGRRDCILAALIRSVWGSKMEQTSRRQRAAGLRAMTTCLIDGSISYPADSARSARAALDGHVDEHVVAAHVRVLSSPARRWPTASSAESMSTGMRGSAARDNCLVVMRWISYIRRRAERVRSQNPLIRRSSSALARRRTKRVTTRTTSHNNVLSVG